MTEDIEMHAPPKPRFDPTFNYGHIFQLITFVITVFSGVIYITSIQTQMQKDISQIEARAGKYIPAIDTLIAMRPLQDDRIQNLSMAVQDIRKTNSELLTQMGKVREDVAGMKATVDAQLRRQN